MRLTLARKYNEVGDVWSFVFLPPHQLDWTAGQSIRIAVPTLYGSSEHRFSIASPPQENEIMVTTRLSPSPFKQALGNLDIGDVVEGNTIEGDFTWRDSPQPKVFVAGGIGITPYHAMLKQRVMQGHPLAVTVIYMDSRGEFTFKPMLDGWSIAHEGLSIVYTPHRLGAADILRHLGTEAEPSHIYLSGPSAMVDTLTEGLLAHGVPQEGIVRDWFTGNVEV